MASSAILMNLIKPQHSMVVITRHYIRSSNDMTHTDYFGAAIVLASLIGTRLMGGFVRPEKLGLPHYFLFCSLFLAKF